ncbi:MAG: lactate racemization operon protein LarA, partial [Nitrospinota bacterium]
ADSASPQEVLQKIREGKIWEEDMWQAQALARILSRHKAIIVTEGVEPERIREMHMEWAPSLEDALEVAFREKGIRARVTVLPEGPALIPEV